MQNKSRSGHRRKYTYVKRGFCTLLAILMVILSSGLYAIAQDSSDLEEDAIYLDESITALEVVKASSAIGMLKIGGHEPYMQGTGGGLFEPDKFVTRAEAAQIFFNLLVDKPSTFTRTFPDVPSGRWYTRPIGVLADLGVINGYSDGTYAPNKSVTRAEFVQLTSRFFKVTASSENPFADVSSNHWAYRVILFASSKGWINGMREGSKVVFRPDDSLTRAQAVTVLNGALERRDANFAQNVDSHGFIDIDGHWAFKQIVEAAKNPNAAANPPSNSELYVIVTASVLNFRSAPNTAAAIIGQLSQGTRLKLLSDANSEWFHVETDSGVRGYVSSLYVILEIPVADGSAGLPSKPSGTSSVVTISSSIESVPQYKTLYLTGTVDGSSSKAVWRSTNTNVATVSNGFVYGVSPGTAYIIIQNSAGDCYKVCFITVKEAEPVRFAYTSQNRPTRGASFDLMAVTDTAKSAVRFVVSGASSGTYETSNYSTESQAASNLPTNNVRVFKRTISLPVAGSYKVRAYSRTGSGFSSSYYEFDLLVGTSSSKTATTTESRRASTEIINIIASFEGFIPTVYYDTLAYNIPTVGYGFVVNKNETFYNNLTRTEAMAMLVNTVNKGNYATAVENFRKNNNLRMSQSQFDALTSFAYNLGGGHINANYDTFKVLLNSVVPPSDISASKTYLGIANVIDVVVYKNANPSSGEVARIPVSKELTISGVSVVNATKEVWYRVTYSGKTGWARSGNIGFRNASGMTRDLAYTDAITFGNNLVQWCHAGGVALWGLYYRRQAEAKLFSFANYADAVSTSPNYKVNPGYTVPSSLR